MNNHFYSFYIFTYLIILSRVLAQVSIFLNVWVAPSGPAEAAGLETDYLQRPHPTSIILWFLWFCYLDVPDLSVTSRSETDSRHLLLLAQQSQWALWVPSPGFSLVLGSSAFGILCPRWVQYLIIFASEFENRLAAIHTVVQARGLHRQNVSWPKQACSVPTALPAGKLSNDQNKQVILTEAFFLLWSLDLLIKHLCPEMMLGAASCSSKCFSADVHPILLWPCSHLLSICFLGTSEWLRTKAWPHAALPSPSMESVFHLC